MDRQNNDYNIENTSELMTGSGKRKTMRIALVAAGVIALLAVVLLVLINVAGSDSDTPQTDESYNNEAPDSESEGLSEEENPAQGEYSKTGMMKGIIIQSGNYLISVDPDGGEVTAVRDFTPNDEDVKLLGNAGFNAFQKLQLYNEDLTKTLARKKSGVPGHDGIYEHIGWVNTDGDFEDITAKAESFDNEDSFSGSPEPLSMYRARNFIDEYIYAEASEDIKSYRMPMDNISPGTLEIYGEYSDIGFFGGESSFVDPNGVMGERRIDGFSSDGYYRKNEAGKHEYVWAGGQATTETECDITYKNSICLRWISKDNYLMTQSRGNDLGSLFLCQRNNDNKFICSEIIPFVEGRTYSAYAVSPDNKRVAVISRKADKSDLYIGDVSNPIEPKKLEIKEDLLYEMELDDTVDLMKGRLLCWSDGNEHPQEEEIRQYLNTPECRYQAKVSAEYYKGLQ